MTRVALVSSSYDPWLGGVEAHVRDLAKHLRLAGDDVEVWTVDRGLGLGTRQVDGITVRDLQTPLPARSLGAGLTFATGAPSAWRRWSRAVQEFRPDLLHVHCFGPNGLYGLALARRHDLPLILTSHGETFGDAHGIFDESALQRWGLRRGVQRAAAVTAVSTMVADDLMTRFGARHVQLVPNGIDLAAHSTRDAGRTAIIEAREPTTPVVFALGRLEHNKGFDLLIRASAALARSDFKHRVVVGGEGREREPLLDLARSLGISGQFELPGRLTPDEVTHQMREASVVVMPSRAESFGIVALEAWRAGTPLIATSRGGIREVLEHEVDALVVDPEETAELASSIRRVLTDPTLSLQLREAGSTSVQRYAWSRVVAEYRDVYTLALPRA